MEQQTLGKKESVIHTLVLDLSLDPEVRQAFVRETEGNLEIIVMADQNVGRKKGMLTKGTILGINFKVRYEHVPNLEEPPEGSYKIYQREPEQQQ